MATTTTSSGSTASADWSVNRNVAVAAAREARRQGLRFFTTTLASSRWKSIEQITAAGLKAQEAVPDTEFWAQNWRKGGLYERRNQLLREFDFYNQQYCGCEFSQRH